MGTRTYETMDLVMTTWLLWETLVFSLPAVSGSRNAVTLKYTPPIDTECLVEGHRADVPELLLVLGQGGRGRGLRDGAVTAALATMRLM